MRQASRKIRECNFVRCFPLLYRFVSRRLYLQIDRENIRNGRQHEIEYIQRRIAILDFVLSNLQCRYLETEPEKVR